MSNKLYDLNNDSIKFICIVNFLLILYLLYCNFNKKENFFTTTNNVISVYIQNGSTIILPIFCSIKNYMIILMEVYQNTL